MAVNWHQVGTDFHQKYEGTFCRFTSPLGKNKEVFSINEIEIFGSSPPSLTLWNPKHGELYLKYTTEAELDFAYPDVGYFQHGKKAFRFVRNYERQWKKGVCSATARILFPYDTIVETMFPQISCEYLESAFQPSVRSFEGGIKKLMDEKAVSVALSKTLAIGLGNKTELLVWFENEPVGEIEKNGSIIIKVPEFTQELKDFVRDTGEYGRAVV